MTNNFTKIILGTALAIACLLGSLSPAAAARRAHAPLGYQLMCLETPSACQGGGAARVSADGALMAKLRRVNNYVNATVKPVADGGVDLWHASAGQGDCNDYATTKRQELIREGVSPSALRLAYVKTRSGVGHAVLVVATSRGDLVLDVLTHQIRPLSQSGYRVMSMATANPRVWS
jgi:predicted transglutaminase-like cysteine proteinase